MQGLGNERVHVHLWVDSGKGPLGMLVETGNSKVHSAGKLY